MMMSNINIRLIGYKFIGKAHSYAIGVASFFFKGIKKPVKKVIYGRTEHLVRQAAKDFGWEEYCTDWKEVVNRDDIDVIDIATPTINHMEIA
jgi:predicted dehydrogenase